MQPLNAEEAWKQVKVNKAGNAQAREALVQEMLDAEVEAARFTFAEFAERGIPVGNKGLRASRNGNGPIAKVDTNFEAETVLVILNSDWDGEA